jgi:hypothetical protein
MNDLATGFLCSAVLIFGGLIFHLLIFPPDKSVKHNDICKNNLKMIGIGLLNHEGANHKFPPVYLRDKAGNKQFSWRVGLLPYMEYGGIYRGLNKNKSWEDQFNKSVLPPQIPEFICPISNSDENDCSSNYVAIIGPGTIWKENGCKTVEELPHGMYNAVAAVEVLDPGKHWAEPFALTVDEVLENMKNRKGVRISTNHQVIHVLFADGIVRRFPTKIQLSLWRKLFNAEVDNFDKFLDEIDPNASDAVEVSSHPQRTNWDYYILFLSLGVWIFSNTWLFYRAVKSRKVQTNVAVDSR